MIDRITNWPSKVSGVWLDEILDPGTCVVVALALTSVLWGLIAWAVLAWPY